jgi:CubicO group peptidase (beta-lactamase class C family)
VAEGRLDLQANVCGLVPEFPHQEAGITPRDLLCHQSGIVHYSNGQVIRTKIKYEVEHPFQDVVMALDAFKESPLLFPPREKYSYSTHAYILLSAVTQRAENKPFAEQVKERIVQPLGLTSLQPDYQWVEIPHRAVGYRKTGNNIVPSSNTDVSWKLGGGGFISNVEDMALYAAALMDNKIMTPEMKSQFWVPQKTSDGSETTMGLGFFIDGADRSLRISHNGSQEKSKTRLVIYPNRREGIVVMSHCENADPGRITTAIFQAITAGKKAIEK